MQPELSRWNDLFLDKARVLYPNDDPSHDILHIKRVVRAALELAAEEGADPWVVLPAAYLHDCVNVPKNDPRRKQASTLSAEAAVAYLKEAGYPEKYFDAIAHAIAAHSFSANIPPETIEAKVVQDADRLDALGAIGIARMFTINGVMKRPYYSEEEFLPETRIPDDMKQAIDHFYVKLFKLPDMMQTASGRSEATARVAYMRDFLAKMRAEVT